MSLASHTGVHGNHLNTSSDTPRHAAVLQIKTIWSVLLRNFDFELIDPFPEPDFESMVVGPKPCRIKYTRRMLSA